MIKATDFDDRVDILPVSNPNIFSMSQRVMLAQQQLQLAIANPALHNLREAYRRVYQALDVDNIDALLKPDPGNPPPKSPANRTTDDARNTKVSTTDASYATTSTAKSTDTTTDANDAKAIYG